MKEMVDGIQEVIINKLDFPRELIKNSYKLIIEEDEYLTIENHRGILKFNSDEVVLKVNKGTICIKGSKFIIVYISGKTLKLKGIFKGVSYENQ